MVGGFFVREDMLADFFSAVPGLDDSKKLTVSKREHIFECIEVFCKKGFAESFFAEKSAYEIDILGIRTANRLAMQEIVKKVSALM